MQEIRGKKVFVGLSGGVDSAVSALLLQRAGARVTGVFIKGWYPPGMPCTWAEDRQDAMRVAAHLGIPFITLDAGAEYKTAVIDYLLSEYRLGRTPNPDVMCNREIKFGVFYRFAKSLGTDAIATGHYRSGDKDQSYFLWAVSKEILAETLFPVGDMKKTEVRSLAKRFRLPVAEKKDSQGVCFLGSVSVAEFLRAELGTHNQALLYTYGQRVPNAGGPWYVVGKDIEKHELHLSHTRPRGESTLHFTSANWLYDPLSVDSAQYRYRGPVVHGKVEGDMFIAEATLPDIVAPGQSLAFYRGHELVGGGIIAS